MTFEVEADRRGARLPAHIRAALLSGDRRLVIVGARGWIGRTLLDLLDEALEGDVLAERVVAFGSGQADIELPSGRVVSQQPLAKLADLPRQPTLLFHLAFLTKDKVAGMAEGDYIAANRALSGQVLASLDQIGVEQVFVASSGAAAFAADPAAAHDLRLYGALKQEDEERFAAWAMVEPDTRRAIVTRIYAVSGPHINKHDTYALANFILSALRGETIEVLAPIPVYRGYVAVRDLLSLVLGQMHAAEGEAVIRFATGGTVLELGDLARRVAGLLPCAVERRPISGPGENRYVGDDDTWRALLARQGLEPLELDTQIIETAAFLARNTGVAGEKTLVSGNGPC
jgi:UDP-glucuronate decarboxylase